MTNERRLKFASLAFLVILCVLLNYGFIHTNISKSDADTCDCNLVNNEKREKEIVDVEDHRKTHSGDSISNFQEETKNTKQEERNTLPDVNNDIQEDSKQQNVREKGSQIFDQPEQQPEQLKSEVVNQQNTEHTEPSNPDDTNDTKLILLWFYEDAKVKPIWYREGRDYKEDRKNKCKYHNCDFTTDRSRYNESTVIVFKERVREWPDHRSSDQLYVHQLTERPGKWHDYIREYNGVFNLTLNYRKTADIVSLWKRFYRLDDPISGPYKLKNPLANKTKMAVWPVSHCITDSRREDYVKELRKYIDVDIVGSCGNDTCPQSLRQTPICFRHWESLYKFYLSFENAVCDDYITEKYYNPLRYEFVPVTLSGSRYNSELMPHGNIDAMDFKSPKELADFLVSVGNNETAYLEYFQWKQTYTPYRNTGDMYCALCKAANIYKNKPALEDYYDYWFSKCDNGYVDRLRREGGW